MSRGPSRWECGLVTLWASNTALGRALEISWEKALKLDRLLADSCYVDDGVILGAVVEDDQGVGTKVRDIDACCVGNGVGPKLDVCDCYYGRGPISKCLLVALGAMRNSLGWALEIILEKALNLNRMWAYTCFNEEAYVP